MLLSLCPDTLDQTRFQNTYEQSHQQFWDFLFWTVFRPSQAPLQFINFFFIFIKAKHFLRCWVIANTLGSSRYLHSWCLCHHAFGLVEDSKARAAPFLRDTESSINFLGWQYLKKENSYTCFILPGTNSWTKGKWSVCHQGWRPTQSQPGLQGSRGCTGLQPSSWTPPSSWRGPGLCQRKGTPSQDQG